METLDLQKIISWSKSLLTIRLHTHTMQTKQPTPEYPHQPSDRMCILSESGENGGGDGKNGVVMFVWEVYMNYIVYEIANIYLTQLI